MDIKRSNYLTIGLCSFLICSFCIGFIKYNCVEDTTRRTSIGTKLHTQAYDDVLVDNVYTFLGDEFTLSLPDIQFEKGTNYQIRIGVVIQEQSCHMEINLIDPEHDLYELYTSNTSDGSRLTFNDYREIPFGAALTGIYTLNFTKLDGPPQNIHIQILEDEQCLQKITDPPNMIRTEIEKFTKKAGGNDDIIYHYLQSQRMYQVFIARISPVRGDQPINITIDHSVRDDGDPPTCFDISLPPHLSAVYSHLSYSFGTAMEGEYKFSTTYELPMDHTNIMFIITDKGSIASGDEGESSDNSTEPEPDPHPQILVSIPVEAKLGIGLGVGIVVLLGAILIVYAKLKNAI